MNTETTQQTEATQNENEIEIEQIRLAFAEITEEDIKKENEKEIEEIRLAFAIM